MLELLTSHLAAHPAASMDELAAAAGVSRATLFRRFVSREALVVAASEQAIGRFVAVIDGARPEEGAAIEALARVASGVASLAPTHGLLALQPLPEAIEAELLERAHAADERIAALVRRGVSAGEFRPEVPAAWVQSTLTWLCVGAADGLRLGTLAAGDVERLLVETVLAAVRFS
ncbi:helix-turn-helix domain-containing protein [Streptosporangium sp. NPDC048865]|uniref:TetR/AcrR family transcriptional regulator n=1 Tax=Streptosporangium sp. NPDC048865 TaxID=3155766 RepID=UPI003443BFEF